MVLRIRDESEEAAVVTADDTPENDNYGAGLPSGYQHGYGNANRLGGVEGGPVRRPGWKKPVSSISHAKASHFSSLRVRSPRDL